MNEFEKKYYEASLFWEGEMLQDVKNMERFDLTASLLPCDINTILDAGCGNGVFVNFLHKKNEQLQITALDRSEKALEFVQTNKTLGDVSNMPFDDRSFDCVSCLEVIEHLPFNVYNKTLNDLVRVADKYLIVSVPYNEVLEDSYTKCPLCKSMFNYELHFRSFNTEKFTSLFDNLGFRNTKTIKAGLSENYKYHNTFRKFFYPEQLLKWRSPVCPICGFEDDKIEFELHKNSIDQKRKVISYFTFIPKHLWPKVKKYYWIIGLFERLR